VIIILRYPDAGTDPAAEVRAAAVFDVADRLTIVPAIIVDWTFPPESVEAKETVTD